MEARNFSIRPTGIGRAVESLKYRSPDSKLTDLLGNGGLLMVFPELAPYGQELQNLITLGHHIDHMHDRGPDTVIRKGGQSTQLTFNTLYSELVRLHFPTNKKLLKNVVGFFSQASAVEHYAHAQQLESDEDIKTYRELVNAIWVRMIVSYGMGLKQGELDPIGSSELAAASYGKIRAAYEPYVNGEEIGAVPGQEKNYGLFLWTMFIQEQFDRVNKDQNNEWEVPALQHDGLGYRERLKQLGANGLLLGSTALMTSIAIRANNAFHNARRTNEFE